MTLRGNNSEAKRRSNWRRIAITSFVIVLVLFGYPRLWGLVSPSGRIPVLVGNHGRSGNLPSNAIWLSPRVQCIDRLDGWIPPYLTLVVDGDCALESQSVAAPAALTLQLWGAYIPSLSQERDEVAPPARYERGMQQGGIIGYDGLETLNEQLKRAPGDPDLPARFTVTERYISRGDNVLSEIHCISMRVVENQTIRTKTASCWGVGVYRDIFLKADFQMMPGLSSENLNKALTSIIDAMIDS